MRDNNRYLGRYTHRIAISNYRLESFDECAVRFRTKHGKAATLKGEEFVRRFLLHVLPSRFVKIRHYGLMAASSKARHEHARGLIEATAPPAVDAPPPLDGQNPKRDSTPDTPAVDDRCPACRTGTLVSRPLPARAGRSPPKDLPS